MRLTGLACFAAALCVLWARPAAAAPHVGPARPELSPLLVQPVRLDLDRDGRADTAAGVPTSPFVVRITLSHAGPHDLRQPARVLAIAGFDYDRDGDLDLLVGTVEGALLWVNDGSGGFLRLPVVLSSVPAAPSSSGLARGRALTDEFFDRNDPAIACVDRQGRDPLDARHGLDDRRHSAACSAPFSQRLPRAPPRS
jgi:hypothetical protein